MSWADMKSLRAEKGEGLCQGAQFFSSPLLLRLGKEQIEERSVGVFRKLEMQQPSLPLLFAVSTSHNIECPC